MKLATAAAVVLALLAAAGLFETQAFVSPSVGAPESTAAVPVMWSWQPDSPMTVARSRFGAAVADGYVFAIAGGTASGEKSQVRPDGRLGPWSSEGIEPLPLPLADFRLVSQGGFVYVVGGDAGSGPLNLVHFARVANGTVQEWKSTSPFPRSGGLRTAASANGHIFVFGAGLPVGPCFSIGAQRATINPDGSLSPWVDLGSLGGLQAGAAVSSGASIYLLGGCGAGGGNHNVFRTTVGPDGLLSSLQEVSSMNGQRESLGALMLGQQIFVAGEVLDRQLGMDVVTSERATILSDGSLSAWERMPGLARERATATLAAAGPSVYALGGVSTQPLSTTERLWLAPSTQALPLVMKGAVP